jgi:NADH-quinone oxidoreductase subunit N
MQLAQVPNLVPALPELFLALVIMALLMFGVFQKGGRAETDVNSFRIVSWMAVMALVLTPLLVLALAGGKLIGFGGMFIADPFAAFCKVLVLIGSAATLIMARNFLETHDMARFEYPILVVFATLGMLMMISANDLISLYLGLEMQSLSLYVIAAFRRDDTRSTEAGLKYFVLGALASGMFLYGASLVYGFAGTTGFDGLAKLFHQTAQGGNEVGLGVVFGIVFILAALTFKVSAVPFHMWTPDVYEGAPTPVTAFFAVAPKIAALALFIRVMVGPFGDLVAQWQQIVVFVSVASMVLGAVAAINQRNIKRLMAYSSIGHVGYALIGLAVGNEAGVRGILIYLAIYLFMNVGTFACILAMRRNGRMVEGIEELAGLGKTHPMLAAAMTVFMFSMAGIPPLAGFFGKLYVFLAAIEAELYGLAIIGVLTSVIGAFYYLRIIRIMYFDDVREPLDRPVEREIGLVAGLSGAVIVLFFLYPGPVVTRAAAAAASLFTG